jgi:hypothetical protein
MSSSSLRIALCISGQPRTWRHCIGSLYATFTGHRCEAFLHLWDDTATHERSALEAAYAPTGVVIDPRPDFTEYKIQMMAQYPMAPPLSVYDMAYANQRVLMAAIQHGGYDLIVRARYDCLFDGTVFDCLAVGPNDLCAPAWAAPEGVNDQFAVGAPAVMQIYAGFYDFLTRFPLPMPGDSFRPEIALMTHLAQHPIHVERRAPDRKLLRETMAGRAFDQVIEDAFHQTAKQMDWQNEAQALLPMVGRTVSYMKALSPLMPMRHAVEPIYTALSPNDKTALGCGPWDQRADLCEMILDALGVPEHAGDADIATIRQAVTTLLFLMDLTSPPDDFGSALLLLSLMSDHRDKVRMPIDLDPLNHLPRLQAATRAVLATV